MSHWTTLDACFWGATTAVWFLVGRWAGQRYERRRVLVIVGDKQGAVPTSAEYSTLRSVERDIILGEMPKS